MTTVRLGSRLGGRRGEGPDWREVRFVALDFEATSAHPRTAHALSVGWVSIEQGRLRCASSSYAVVRHVAPAVPALAPGALAVHRLAPADLAAGEPADEVAARVRVDLRGAVLVAHQARLERALLAGWQVPVDRVVDTWHVLRRLEERAGTPDLDRRLVAAAARHDVPRYRAHHALADAWTTALLLLALAARIEDARGACRVQDLLLLGRP